MRKSSISSILVLGLVASLLQLAPAAYSNGQTVDKTFVITDSANLPIENVSVALIGFNEDTNETFLSEVDSTGITGTVTITVPANIDYYGWSAQPEDTDYAIFTDYSVAQGETETLYAKLKRANLVVQVGNVDEPLETTGASIYFPSTDDGASGGSYRVIIEPSAFGIDLSPALVETGSYSISVEPNATTTKFAAKYGLEVEDYLDNEITYREFRLFTDISYSTPLAAGDASVYTLAFSGENFSGQLRNASGGPLTIPSGVRVFAQVLKANANGSVNLKEGEEASAFFQVRSNGTFNTRIFTPASGEYFVQFTSSGSTSIPTFLSNSFWVTTSNNTLQFSTSSTGTFQANNVFNFSASIPANPNVKIRSTKANGSANGNIYISLSQKPQDGGNEIWWGYASASNGISSFSMPDGTYRIFIQPSEDGLLHAEYRLKIDEGIAYVSTGTGSIINADSAGVFQLALGTPNLQVRLVRPGGALLNDANVNVDRNIEQGNSFVTNAYTWSGLAALLVPDGSFTLTVNPSGGSLAAKKYQLEVLGSAITISDGGTPVLPQNGIYTLSASSPNITGVVKELIDGDYFPFAPRREKSASVNIEKKHPYETNRWDYYTESRVGSGGAFAALVSDPGIYRIKVGVNNSPNAVNTTFEQFTITNDLKIETIAGSTLDSFTGADALQLELRPPTMLIRVRQPGSSQNLEGASIELSGDSLGNNSEWYDTGYSGVAGISVPEVTDGEEFDYEIRIRPPSNLSSAEAAITTYKLKALADGDFILTDYSDVTVTPVALVDGLPDEYVLSLDEPNVTGIILNSEGGAFDGLAGNYASVDVQQKVDENGYSSWRWINQWADVFTDGSFGLTIADEGTYRLLIEPFGMANSSGTKTVEFDVDASRQVTAVADDPESLLISAGKLNFGNIQLSSPTALFKVRAVGSTQNLTFTAIEIHQLVGVNWEWLDWRNVGSDGVATFTATESGEYRFTAMPSDISDNSVKKTYEGTVTCTTGLCDLVMHAVTLDSDLAFVLTLGTPNVSGRLVDSRGRAVINEGDAWTTVHVQELINEGTSEERWEWTDNHANVRADGKFALDISGPGTFRLRIESGGRSDLALTYSDSFTISDSDVANFNKSFGNITLNPPALSGSVLSKDGEPQAGAQVIAIDVVTGKEMWEYSTSTDSSGTWGMVLPAGSYKIYARPGWQDATQGNSLEVSGIVVNSAGQATLSGSAANAKLIELNLSEPTWSGTVVEVLGADPPVLVRNASVCLFVIVDRRHSHSCADSNRNGEWALSMPSGFTSFNKDSTLTIRPNQNPELAEARYTGKEDIEEILGAFQPNTTFSGIELAPGVANFRGVVYEPDAETPVRDTWVEIYDVSANEWLGGSGTNSSGQFSLSLPVPDSESTWYRITVYPSGSDIGEPLSRSTFFALVTAADPGSNTDSEVELFTTMSTEGEPISADLGLYSLVLKAPTAAGFVFGPDGNTPIRDSFVVPVDVANNRHLWEMGQNSRANGSFGLALEDGTYRVFANSPYLSNYSRSAMCSVVISGGSVVMDEPSVCVKSGSKINLELREPNLTFKLYEPGVNGQLLGPAVANAHVGVSVGEWYGWAQSSEDGTVSLFIDQEEIAERNPSWTGESNLIVRLNVQAPHDNSTLASWQCAFGEMNKPICENIGVPVVYGQEYTATTIDLGDIVFLAANTFVNVTTPESPATASRGAWVSVFKQEDGGWNRYLNSAGTNEDGMAALRIDEACDDPLEGCFTVEIHPPWDDRAQYARKTISGLTLAEVQGGTWSLALPNLTLTIKQAPAPYEVSRWSNVWIEEVIEQDVSGESRFVTQRWINGYGSDESGVISMSLDSDALYRINVNPGPGSVGTRTSCIVSVSSDGVVTPVDNQCDTGGMISESGEMDLTLSAGNFTGSVKLGSPTGNNAVGAIVFAEAVSLYSDSTPVTGVVQETVVDSEGNFGLQLDPRYNWVVKVFYVNPPGAPGYASISLPQTLSWDGLDFTALIGPLFLGRIE